MKMSIKMYAVFNFELAIVGIHETIYKWANN